MLIIGGLIVLAIVALLGAVLLSRGGGEEGTARREVHGEERLAGQQISTPSSAQKYKDERPEEQDPRSERPLSASRDGEATTEIPFLKASEKRDTPLASGHLYELAAQIQVLNQQSIEIEQRLNRISTMLERIERSNRENSSYLGSSSPHNS